MQINTNGKRNITLDFDAPKKFKLKKDGAEIPYIRTGKNSFRLGRNIDGVLDLEEVIEQPRIVKPMQLQSQQMALVNPNDVLMINQAAQQLEVEQNILSETQKRVEQTQAYLDIQQQRINESVLSVQGLEADNSDRITATENGIFNLAGELAKAEGNSADADNYIISELDEHKNAENPHGITKETIGLNKVDNTSDLDKPISKAVQSALDEKADKDEIQAIRDELGEYQEKNDRFTNALSNYTGGLAGNQLPDGGLTGQVLGKKSDISGDIGWIDSSASVTVDDELSLTSENPVQNKVITSNINSLQTSKQDVISDLSEIRQGAALGATAVQPSALTPYATQNWVLQQGYLTEIPAEYVTESELTAKGYQTAADVETAITAKGYTTMSAVEAKGYITNAALVGYATESYVDNGLNGKQDKLTQTQLDAVNSGANTTNIGQIATNTSGIADINTLIPNQATSSNQLADKDFVNSSINSMAAFYITSDVAGDPFATRAALIAGPYYFRGQLRTPTQNDYALVSEDETHDDLTSRYMYDGGQWVWQYTLNNTKFTQAQIDAINSGITDGLVAKISTNETAINNHIADKTNPHEVTKAQVGLSNVDNTSDLNKPISTATQTALNSKQDTISDLATIRSGAALGATALQPSALNGYATQAWVGQQGYITGITSSDVTTALGYTPYNSSNPNGYITSAALTPYALSADLATVATSGSYNDLSDKPTIPSAVTEATVSGWGFTKNTGTVTSVNNVAPVNGNVTLSIPAAQVNSDWDATSGVAQILNKPTLATVATSGSYNDLSDKPTIPANISGNKVNGAPLSNTSSHFFGISTSAATDVEKEVSIPSITELTAGVTIIVLPTITSTVANATLKLNNFAAYPIRYGNAAITTTSDAYTWTANTPSVFVFDGDYWRFVCQGYRQTYSAMSVAEGTTGTATTARSMRADYLKSIILGTKLTGLSTSINSAITATDTVLVGMGKLQAQIGDIEAALHAINSGS